MGEGWVAYTDPNFSIFSSIPAPDREKLLYRWELPKRLLAMEVRAIRYQSKVRTCQSIKSGLLRRLHVRNILAARLSQVIHDKLKRWYTRLYVSRRAQTYPFLPSDNKYRIVCQCCSAVHAGMLGGMSYASSPYFTNHKPYEVMARILQEDRQPSTNPAISLYNFVLPQ